MFGRMMNNYYYGKSGKGDFRKEDLPHNRRDLFRDTFKTRLSSLFRINMLYMIIFLPAMILLLYFGATGLETMNNRMLIEENDYASYMEMYKEAGQELSIAEEQYNELKNSTFDYGDYARSLLYQALIWLIPCIAITGPLTAGVSYVTRNWARDEHAFIWSDFKDAVKANWKIPLVLSTITGVLPTGVYAGWLTYGNMAADNMLMVIPQALVVLVGILWALMITYMHPLTVTYDLSLKGVLRNGFLLAVARLPFSVGIRLLHCVPLLIAFIAVWFFGMDPLLALVILSAYYILIGFGLSRFVTASYTNAVFDRFINSRIEGAKVNQGLREPDDPDDGYDDETEEKENADSSENGKE